MDIVKKVELLSTSAKYDVSCSSSGSDRQNYNGLGNGVKSGICHSWSDDGRCISLLKILFTNYCIYDCAYCINRKSNDVERTSFTTDEIVGLTINFYKRNYIEGLFLSSGIVKSPNFTMERLFEVVYKLRFRENFNGYIHLKAIPGADIEIIKKVGYLVDRLSVNIEIPSNNGLKLLAPDKKKDDILTPISFIGRTILQNRDQKRESQNTKNFVGAGQSTQMIVGATPESDYDILYLTSNLYKNFNMKRVYYSAYVPVVTNDNRLPTIVKPPLKREHRLYQADWLLRFYKFNIGEIISEENPFLDDGLDPKFFWALKNLSFFPVEINGASYDTLLRVPGIGVKSAQKIVSSRKFANLNFNDLKKIGVVLKRAKYFITCNGKVFDKIDLNETHIKSRYLLADKSNEVYLPFL